MSRVTVDVTFAPHVREKIRECTARFAGAVNTPENCALIEADVAYHLQCFLGVPPGIFVVTARAEEDT
jgi:hypothetical protein